VTSETDIKAAVETAVRQFGKLDAIYNNAGAPGDPAPLLELSTEGFERTIALLTRSVVLGTRIAARQFIAQGTPGAIVNTASAAGLQAGWSSASYTIAKHAVIGVTRHAAAEFGPHRVRSNAIAPGIIRTPIMARAFGIPMDRAEEFAAFLEDRHGSLQPIGRLGLPEDVAEAALWLVSDASTFVTGIVLPVDGGATSIYSSEAGADIVAAVKEFNAR
jgi:NAD(P)-dependent dehydrogenase (short-subunit alcohol dehydrogenase family)